MLLAAAIPILIAKCLACHNTEAKVSAFDLSTREALLRGGAQGAAMTPGAAAQSRLFQYVSSGKMPPSQPLTKEEVEEIRRWIDAGAQYDQPKLTAKARPRAGLDWWSLQSPRKPAVPQVAGVTHPIDAFIAQKLREKGLDFSPTADKRTLLRRLHFSLAGLPPKDVNASFEETLNTLLASPAYGERWARYWLDVVRFGESDGGEHNNERFTAWRYRDYVIDAFNSDKPYTQFIREQIAGDVLDANNPKMVAATGFLVAGPWDSVTKQINRDELMRKTIRQDELDDFVTTTFATFQGLTVNCARCHDHKFDPIPTRDYYRLTAVFRGVTYGERGVYTEQQKKDYDALAAPIRQKLSDARKALAAVEDPAKTRLLRTRYEAMEMARTLGKRIPVNPIFNRNTFAPVTARQFRFVITAQQGKSSPRIDRMELLPAGHVIENWRGEKAGTDDAPAILTIDKPLTVSEIRWAADASTGNREGMPRVYRFEASDDGVTWREVASSLQHDVPAEVALPEAPEAELLAALTATQREQRASLLAEQKRLQGELDRPALPSVHAAKLEPEMTPAFLLDRGSLSKPLEEVAPGTLTAIRQLAPDLPKGTDAERRLALANWIANEKNPLTARVIVNRVWYAHFGSGLVNTPSDFGFNGDRPSHPELLDWLATEFMDNGWSIKWLQRLIVTSRTWQQSSKFNAKAHAIDAANRLLWRMEPRRMDAETIRDSMLALSGSLNTERGGPGFLLQKKQTKGSYLYIALDENDPSTWRRSVYKFVARGAQRIFMDSFDCPDPAVATPQRSISNTPVQALTLLNNRFVLHQADLLATRVKALDGVYEAVFNRAPTARERELGEAFIRQHGLPLFCRTIFNTNEFLYVP
jgi:hypothetical protein